MTKAVVVPFHPGVFVPTDHYRVYEKAWLSCWKKWQRLIDKAYIIDHGWDFKAQDEKFEIIKLEISHWGNLTKAIPEVKEDIIVLMDCDTLFYNKEVMEYILRRLDAHGASLYDVVTIADGSGGVDISKKYPFMAPNKNRAERRRFAPYLCFIRKDLMMKTSLNFGPTASRDSFGTWTEEVLNQDPRILELADDRNTLRLNEDGTTERDTWLDGPGYKWSEPLDKTKELGYYHIRNFVLGLNLVNGFWDDRATYLHYKEITPFSEATRSLAWLWIFTEKFGSKEQLERMDSVIADFTPRENWLLYIGEFYNYHSWIKDI